MTNDDSVVLGWGAEGEANWGFTVNSVPGKGEAFRATLVRISGGKIMTHEDHAKAERPHGWLQIDCNGFQFENRILTIY